MTFQPTVIGGIDERITFESPDIQGAPSTDIVLKGDAGVWTGDVSGNWTSANSPVILGGDVIVEFGTSLTIDPGVEVLVDTSFGASTTQFLVKGSFIAEGTESNPIIFGAVAGQEIPGVWRGIRLMLRENEFEYNQPALPSLANAPDENEAEDRARGRTGNTE